jgi:hypothetical protein
MPFGLKNALPTFVRDMHRKIGDLIGYLVDVYVDDIIVKVKSYSSLLDSLAIVFDKLRSMRTMLKSKKCVFGVSAGKLLGFLVHTEEAMPLLPSSHQECPEAHGMPGHAQQAYL